MLQRCALLGEAGAGGFGERGAVDRRFDAARLEIGRPHDLPRLPNRGEVVAAGEVGASALQESAQVQQA